MAEITIIGEDNKAADNKRGITKCREHLFDTNRDMPVGFDKKLNYKQYPQLLTNIETDNDEQRPVFLVLRKLNLMPYLNRKISARGGES
jgi:hypothetical protein